MPIEVFHGKSLRCRGGFFQKGGRIMRIEYKPEGEQAQGARPGSEKAEALPEKESLAPSGKKDHLGYLLSFYSLPLVIGAILLFLLVHFFLAGREQEKTALYVSLYDCGSARTEEELSRDFCAYLGREEVLAFYTTGLLAEAPQGSYGMASMSRFYADTAAGQVDAAGFGKEEFSSFAKTDCFLPLSEIDGMKKWTEEHPEDLFFREGQPVGIYARALPRLALLGLYTESPDAVIGILKDSPRREMAETYLMYLLGESNEKGRMTVNQR